MSNAVDWGNAPEGAEFYAAGNFRKDGYFWSKDGIWKRGVRQGLAKEECHDYQERPQQKPMKYEYGVEYPTNGVKPDLQDDVLVEQFFLNQWIGPLAFDKWSWGSVAAFRIVDQRYKPAELAEPTQPTSKYDRTITGKYGTGKCTIDVYRVLAAYDVTDSEVAHAVKKLLAPGQRGVKEERQDIEEAIQSLQAWIARMDDEGVK